EIGDTFSKIAEEVGMYFEYSSNEKVALEVAAGAAISGVRSLVSFKHFGLNVASDSLFPLAYLGVKKGMVVVFSDDPNCWSSAQSEQDSRYYARIAHLPLFEPSEPREAKEMVKKAFDISEEYGIPVLVRLTTRVSHTRGVVELGKIKEPEVKGSFEKGIVYRNFPPKIVETHAELHEKLGKLWEYSNKCEFNFTVEGEGKQGIVTSGVSYLYVLDSMKEVGKKLPLLKIGMSYPFPSKLLSSFSEKLESLLVVEELDPVLETEVRLSTRKDVHGKDMVPISGELNPSIVTDSIKRFLGIETKDRKKTKIGRRKPKLCPGCPYRAVFYAVRKALGDKIFAGDIGCYMLGIYPPFEEQDFFLSMGSSISVSHGISKATEDKPVVFIGDSTFFHAGIPGLINAVHNNGNILVIIMDNTTTAMTGHQPHPGTPFVAGGKSGKMVRIEDVVKACGVDELRIVNSYDIEGMVKALKEVYGKKGVGVIIARGECRLKMVRRMVRNGLKIEKYRVVDKEKVNVEELKRVGCPAIIIEGDDVRIDEEMCWGCGVCAKISGGIEKV
ncbi:MAG: thiamine pyrophosphate-dependent enzyme, partial [Candidatus Syntropharchaeia archaeon]